MILHSLVRINTPVKECFEFLILTYGSTITIIPVLNNSNDEIIQQYEHVIKVEEQYTVDKNITKLWNDIIRVQDEIIAN